MTLRSFFRSFLPVVGAFAVVVARLLMGFCWLLVVVSWSVPRLSRVFFDCFLAGSLAFVGFLGIFAAFEPLLSCLSLVCQGLVGGWQILYLLCLLCGVWLWVADRLLCFLHLLWISFLFVYCARRVVVARSLFLFSVFSVGRILGRLCGIRLGFLGVILSPWCGRGLHDFCVDLVAFWVVSVWWWFVRQFCIALLSPGGEPALGISGLFGRLFVRSLFVYSQTARGVSGSSGALWVGCAGLMGFFWIFLGCLKVLYPLFIAC
ncbi:hypothetical protein [Shigella boydii]|uniref:hypothetical protein n=1 Tax=Shigella boydii TaxID=621 RepID=UPI000AD73F47|nr:hypothetical protein [Shigella boydii]